MRRAGRTGVLLVLAPGTALEHEEGGVSWLRTAGDRLSLGRLPGEVAQALTALSREGLPEHVLAEQVRPAGPLAEAHLQALLSQLTRRGVLHYAVHGPGGPLATLEGSSPWFELSPKEPAPEIPLRLSRFALLRRDGDALVLDSARSHARVVLHQPAALTLTWSFVTPSTWAAARTGLSRAEAQAQRALVELLARAGFLVPADESGLSAEEREPRLGLWEVHDLLFHTRTRSGDRTAASYRGDGRFPPLPAVRPPQGPMVALPTHDPERATLTDPPLATVMERRRSIREYGTRPLSLARLGELLHRCARVRELRPGERDELSWRPYPSGGARYPLEVYLTVRACEGLEPGVYHYEPLEHRLESVRQPSPRTEALLAMAQVGREPPQVLLTLAARFQRVSWKYDTIAYSLILQEAGALMQSLHLTATAIGLAACAVGTGDAEAFARAAGTERYEEASVAELALGSLPGAEE